MVKQSRAALLPTNLPHLQNLIKRDSSSYKEEFLLQWQHYQSSYSIFLIRPDEESQTFVELAGFIAQVNSRYSLINAGIELLSGVHGIIPRTNSTTPFRTSYKFIV